MLDVATRVATAVNFRVKWYSANVIQSLVSYDTLNAEATSRDEIASFAQKLKAALSLRLRFNYANPFACRSHILPWCIRMLYFFIYYVLIQMYCVTFIDSELVPFRIFKIFYKFRNSLFVTKFTQPLVFCFLYILIAVTDIEKHERSAASLNDLSLEASTDDITSFILISIVEPNASHPQDFVATVTCITTVA